MGRRPGERRPEHENGRLPRLRRLPFVDVSARVVFHALLLAFSFLTLAPFAWTDRTLVPGVTRARTVHVAELRTALDQAYQTSRQAPPTYTDPALAVGRTTIKKVHLDELRAAVLGLRGP